MTSADVVVIGAGFAGLSAAVRLADAGRRVVVVESAPRLGGRATTFPYPATGERVDNGQHVLFGCYRATYAFLRRLETDSLAPLDPRLRVTIVGPDGRSRNLSCPRLPTPWHLVAAVLRWNALPLRDRLTALKLAPALLRRTSNRTPGGPAVDGARGLHPGRPSQTVAEWLATHGQSPELCRWLWYPLAIAALNQSPAIAAAASFERVLRDLFGSRADDSALGIPAVPLDELYAGPAARFIEARGGAIVRNAPGRVCLNASGAIAAVRAGAETIATDTVVSAVPWFSFPTIWPEGCPRELSSIAAAAAKMQSSPIVSVNLWLDAAVVSQRFVGLVDRPMHWIFNKSVIFGADAGHVSLVASDAPELAALENDRIVEIAVRDLEHALPLVKNHRVVRSVVVRERRATFSLAISEPSRPGTTTPLRGFYLAGDWVQTGLPATIESAVQSGHAAADRILESATAGAGSSAGGLAGQSGPVASYRQA